MSKIRHHKQTCKQRNLNISYENFDKEVTDRVVIHGVGRATVAAGVGESAGESQCRANAQELDTGKVVAEPSFPCW